MALKFHHQIISDLLEDSNGGLVILSSGLSLAKLITSLLILHSPSQGTLLLLLSPAAQSLKSRIIHYISSLDSPTPTEITADLPANQRYSLYSSGSPFFITPRILIVDLLTQRIPVSSLAGIFILNAHSLSETSTEAFIVRIVKSLNGSAYVRAFSDRPQAMVSGFAKTERTMRALFLRRLHLWPRFQLDVSQELEREPPEVVDIRVSMSNYMVGIQKAIIEVMDACLKEMKKTNKVDVDDLTVESGLFKSFDEIVRRQLDPIWHTLGKRTKQLVSDLKTLRKLLDYLVRYDAVSFLKFLDTLRVSESYRSVWLFAESSYKIFDFAKKRVYRLVKASDVKSKEHVTNKSGKKRKSNGENDSVGAVGGETATNMATGVVIEEVLEEAPKWKVLREILEETQDERQKQTLSEEDYSDNNGIVLVACKDERSCMQLEDCITNNPQKVMREEWEMYLLSKIELRSMQTPQKKKQKTPKGFGILDGVVPVTTIQNSEGSSVGRQEHEALMAAASSIRKLGKTTDMASGNNNAEPHVDKGSCTKVKAKKDLPSLRRSIRSCNKKTGNNKPEIIKDPENEEKASEASTSAPREANAVHPRGAKKLPPVHFYALESDQPILDILKPSVIIVYHPDMGFVREIEVYKAENPLRKLKVYFLFYDESTEVQKFEASIRRENGAFESLIRQKSSMMIPVDQSGDPQRILIFSNCSGMMDKDEPFVYNEVDYKTPKQSPQTWPMDKIRQSRFQHKMSSLLSPVSNAKSLLLQCLWDAKSDPLPRRHFPVSCSDEGILMDGVLVTSATKKKVPVSPSSSLGGSARSSIFRSQHNKKNTELSSPESESGRNQETSRSQQSSSAGKGSPGTPKAANPSNLQASAEPFILKPRQASPFPLQQHPYNPQFPCAAHGNPIDDDPVEIEDAVPMEIDSAALVEIDSAVPIEIDPQSLYEVMNQLNITRISYIEDQLIRSVFGDVIYEKVCSQPSYQGHFIQADGKVTSLAWQTQFKSLLSDSSQCTNFGKIRDQSDHLLCWDYTATDLVSEANVRYGWEDKFHPLSAWHLCMACRPDLLGNDPNHDDLAKARHMCYSYDVASALFYMKYFGLPPIDDDREFDCSMIPIPSSKNIGRIESVVRFTCLEDAASYLEIGPLGADLVYYSKLFDKRCDIYRGPLEIGTSFGGYHAVIIESIREYRGDIVAVCRMSNGTSVGDNGYVYVSCTTMYMILDAHSTNQHMIRHMPEPQRLLTNFVGLRMVRKKKHVMKPASSSKPKEKEPEPEKKEDDYFKRNLSASSLQQQPCVQKAEPEHEYFMEKRNLEDMWKAAFLVGKEWDQQWDQQDALYEVKWNFKNVEEALEEGGKLHGKKVYVFGCTESQLVSHEHENKIVIVPTVVCIESTIPPSDKIGVASVQGKVEEIIPMKDMKMDWFLYPLVERDGQDDKMDFQIFILGRTQRRSDLNLLKEDRVKKFNYYFPYIDNPFKEDEYEQSTVVHITFPSEPPVVCEYDWAIDNLQELTDDLIKKETLVMDQKDEFNEFVKEQSDKAKTAYEEVKQARDKAKEGMNEETKEAYKEMKLYKFYPLPSPHTPDVAGINKSSVINKFLGKAHEVF